MFRKTVYLSIIFFMAILTSVKASDLPYKEGELLIRFATKADGIQRTSAERNQILASFDAGTVKTSFKLVPSLSVVKLPVNLTVVDALPKLRGKSGILYVEPNYKIRLASTLPNDTRFDELWAMHNTGQTGGTEDADIDAPEAWDIATGANDIIVAVIDTGVDYTHPDLAANMWINETELNGTTDVDDDNNGYIDDIYGYDFGGYDVNYQDNDPMDEYGHGTHVAGTLGAVGNNSEGITGVCWSARIMALKIFPPYFISEWEALVSNAVEAIEYAVDNDAKVINASWTISNNYSQALKDAIEDAGDANIVFVAAASNYSNSPWYDNDATPDYPSSYDCNNIISVMATDHDDDRSSFSHYGATTVDLGAPGSDILSCVPGNDYESWGGTSMAAPHVAGACALVWAMNPELSHLEVKEIILNTVDVIVPPLECVSQGRLNLYNAIVEAGTQAGKQAVLLNKIDDVNGPVLPGDYITYTISFENTVRGPNDANFPFGDLTNVTIVDHLPAEVDCNNPFDPNYNSNDRTYTWNIGTLQEDESDSVELTVIVNNLAEPLGKITNVCVIEANEIWPKTAIETTDVNCWSSDIIYVDMDAVAIDNTGMSWEHAYTDLQEAMYRARKCGCEQIWVAEGMYKPAKAARSISFELINNVALYGGFPPGGGAWTERNPNVYETILSGDIAEPDYHSDNSYHIVKCENVYNAILDGFTITAGNANALGYADPNGCGGGIYGNYSLSSTITNCAFSDNSACYGGAIYDYNSSNANITNCIFTDNTAEYNGGGIYNYQSSPTIINCTFSGNSVTTVGNSYGGAMYNTNSSEPNVTNCTFSDNSAREGGAVYNYSDSGPNISNCVFKGNTANDFGGGMVNSYESSPTIINCTFSGNSATTVDNSYGGAICNWDSSDPNITNCTFSDNSANKGGGVYNNSSSPKITYCLFTGNFSDANGGGLHNESSDPNIANCIFTANDADMGGGLFNTSSSPNMTNCIIIGNTAYSFGGGITNYDNYNNSLTLTNCTVSENWAHYGGGMFSWNYADANLSNCIFWDNVAGTNGNEIYNDGTSTVNVTYCDVNEVWAGTGNIIKDPCFFEVEQSDGSWTEDAFYDSSTFQSTLTDENADWAINELAGKFVNPYTLQDLQFFIVSNDVTTIKVWSDVTDIAEATRTYQIYDYHLTTDSPCIDAGDPNFNPDPNMTDIDGERRVVDGDANGIPTVDMGADEYYWSPADFYTDGFVNFFDYAFFASAWLTIPTNQYYNEVYDLVDNNCIDSNDLARFCEDWLWQTAWAKAFPFSYGQGMGKSMGMDMGEGFFPSIQAKQAQPELTAADIEEILKWLEELWLTDDEVRKVISEDDWLKFIESVKQVLKEIINN